MFTAHTHNFIDAAAMFSSDFGTVVVGNEPLYLTSGVFLGTSQGLWLQGQGKGGAPPTDLSRPVIDGGDQGFRCLTLQEFLQGRSAAVVVSDLIFRNCGDRRIQAAVPSLGTANTTSGNGGGILTNGTQLILHRVDVHNSWCSESGGAVAIVRAPRQSVASKVAMYNNTAELNAGGLYVGASTVVVHKATFHTNTAGLHGGGLYAGGACLTGVTSSTLIGSNIQGATVYVAHASFLNNTALGGDGGGLGVSSLPSEEMLPGGHVFIYHRAALVLGDGVTFRRNSAPQGSGGGIAAMAHSDLGGGPYCSWVPDLELNPAPMVIFDGNSAGGGGGLSVGTGTRAGFLSAVFIDNAAVAPTSPVHTPTDPNVTEVPDILYSIPIAPGVGGSVLVAGQGAFWCQGCQMSGSTSSDRGGGLGILDNGVVNVTGNTISNCHAGGDGGAVALSQGSSVLVQSTLLTSNVAEENGGGIAIVSSVSSISTIPGYVLLQDVTMTDNMAVHGSGGNLFTEPFATPCVTCTITGGKAHYGNDFATPATSLVIVDKGITQATPQRAGLPIVPHQPLLEVHDDYGQLVNVSSQMTVRVDVGGGKVVTAPVLLGKATFGSLKLVGAAGSKQSLSFSVAGGTNVASAEMTLELMNCGDGYVFSGSKATGVCDPCRPGTYALGPNAKKCLNCPYGSDCGGGDNVTNAKGFYGVVVPQTVRTNDNATYDTLSMLSCPSGFCGWSLASTGGVPSVTACLHNRTGTLCGACKPGYAPALVSSTCVPMEHCNDAPWFMPLWGMYALVYAGYLVMWQWAKPSSGLFSITTYFYQMATLVTISDPVEELGAGFMRVVSGLFSLKTAAPSSGDSGIDSVCPFPMSPVGRLAFNYLLPAAIGVVLVLLKLGYVIQARLVLWCCARRQMGAAFHEGLLSGQHLVSRRRYLRKRSCLRRIVRRCSRLPPCLQKTFPDRLASAAVRFVLYAYAHVVFTSFDLLQCVTVGSKKLLFRAASVECYQPWQFVLLPVVGIMCLAPLAVPVCLLRNAEKRRRPHLSGASISHGMLVGAPDKSTAKPSAAVAALTLAYRPGYPQYIWAAWLLLQRLLLVVMSVVAASEPLSQQVVQSLLCVTFLCTHLLVRPFANKVVNTTQSVFHGCLLVIALLNIVPAAVESLDAPITPDVSAVLEGSSIAALVLFCVPGTLATVVQCHKWVSSWRKSGRRHREQAGIVNNNNNTNTSPRRTEVPRQHHQRQDASIRSLPLQPSHSNLQADEAAPSSEEAGLRSSGGPAADAE